VLGAVAGGAVGKVASKLGRWGKVAKPKTRQGRIGNKGDAGRSAILRPVGKFIESVDDIIANPALLDGKNYAQVRGTLNGSKDWVNNAMTKTRGADKGWVFRQVNSQGQPTGRLIQYHPGSRRHLGGNPYWKISDGTNTFRFPADQGL